MSHFNCFVVGDVDDVMARFNEQDEEYVRPCQETREEIDRTLSYFNNPEHERTYNGFKEAYPDEADQTPVNFYAWYTDRKPVYSREELNQSIYEHEPCFLVEDGEIVEAYSYYNPDAKYDYYCVIGEDSFARFGGAGFIMKDGSKANTGLVKDIDIDATVAAAVQKERGFYREVIDGAGELHHTAWPVYLERVDRKEITIDEARELYRAQPDIKRFDEWARLAQYYFIDADKFLVSEDEYVKDVTVPIFCANIMGDWYEEGQMGWWGIVSDQKEPSDWKQLIESKLREAQNDYPDEEFHFLDCHI